jgi:hypothetical protein
MFRKQNTKENALPKKRRKNRATEKITITYYLISNFHVILDLGELSGCDI